MLMDGYFQITLSIKRQRNKNNNNLKFKQDEKSNFTFKESDC